MGKKKTVNEMEFPKEHDKDLYFNNKHDELCLTHKNEFVAVKNQQVYSNRDPLKLEILNENNIDPRYEIMEFIKDR